MPFSGVGDPARRPRNGARRRAGAPRAASITGNCAPAFERRVCPFFERSTRGLGGRPDFSRRRRAHRSVFAYPPVRSLSRRALRRGPSPEWVTGLALSFGNYRPVRGSCAPYTATATFELRHRLVVLVVLVVPSDVGKLRAGELRAGGLRAREWVAPVAGSHVAVRVCSWRSARGYGGPGGARCSWT